MLKNKVRKKVLFILFALFLGITFACLIAEILIRVFAPQNLSGTWRVHLESGLVVNKSSGTSLHQQNGREVVYKFSDFHTRGMNKNEGKEKILVLGDSFTFGWLLDEEKTYIGLLQKQLDGSFPGRYKLLNAAAGGWGTASYTRYLEEIGNSIKPSKVIVFMSTDDIGRAIKSGLYQFDEESKILTSVNLQYSKLKEFLRSFPGYQLLLENSHLFQLSRRVLLSSSTSNENPHTAKNGPRSRELNVSTTYSRELGKALFLRLKNWCDTNNSSLIVVTNGWGRNLEVELKEGDLERLEPTVAFQSIAKEFFKNESIPFFDTTELISKARAGNEKDFVIPLDCHPNEKGAELIFSAVWDSFLKEEIK